jgi:hypothetical protein
MKAETARCRDCDGTGLVCRAPAPGERAHVGNWQGRISFFPQMLDPLDEGAEGHRFRFYRFELCPCVRGDGR